MRENEAARVAGRSLQAAARAVAIVCVILTLACKSGPERIAYNSLDAAVTSAQAGMSAFNTFYQAGKATEAQRQQVLAAYAKFQAAVNVAIDIARLSNGQPLDLKLVSDAAFDLLTLIATLKGG